ncbi:hypothetical protein [Bordetella genomosp. 13]|uniref:hypothetical protein n=1 Tax=Bordetella genomosp. 13 TaxID=463040 RepID=UPI00119D415F|nr:hypothetical protein [Bordetella genomosp. 13]
MSASRRTAIAFVFVLGVLGAAPVLSAQDNVPARLGVAGGKPVFQPPGDWRTVSQWDKEGTHYAEYRFPLKSVAGQFAVARLSLRLLARSIDYADLPAEEARALEHASDEAIQDTMREVEGMPGMEFEAGGAQLIYTALENGKRYHYVQFISVKGVTQDGSEAKPAVAVGLRCRSAVDEDSPQRAAAAEELESRCYDLLADLGGVEGGVAGPGGDVDAQGQDTAPAPSAR